MYQPNPITTQNTAKALQTLELNKIIDLLCEHALSAQAVEKLRETAPLRNEAALRRQLDEVTCARAILDAMGSPPLPAMMGLAELLTLCATGAMLVPDQLGAVRLFAASCRRVKAYLRKAMEVDDTVALYGGSIDELSGLQAEIDRCIRGDEVDSAASPALRDIRRKIEQAHSQIKEKLGKVLSSKKAMLADSYVSNRNGRFVVPVKREYRSRFPGSLVEISGSGGTCFMEPDVVAKLQAQLGELQVDEDGEVRRILYTLSAMVSDLTPAIRLNMEAVEILDVLFAKAKLSADMGACAPLVTTDRLIHIRQGRHPLIPREQCVPLDFSIGGDIRGVVITGPNTGGKTVTLKTVGLLCAMAQSGLHIPAAPESTISMQGSYWCDIGDSQGIAENLSTFSGHMTNVIEILRGAGRNSLVLLDELGSGTDPGEGMGLAIAVLDELRSMRCLFLVTTHYPQVKDYAEAAPEIQSARMAMDSETLSPLYRLEQGKVGESCALLIARRLGLPEHLLERAGAACAGQWGAGDAVAVAPVRNTPTQSGGLLQRQVEHKGPPPRALQFEIGDCVTVYPEKASGLVFATVDDMGRIGVQLRGKKRWIGHKRLKMRTKAEDLYPGDYDLSVVFDTVSNRKAHKNMDRRGHSARAQAEYSREEWQNLRELREHQVRQQALREELE